MADEQPEQAGTAELKGSANADAKKKREKAPPRVFPYHSFEEALKVAQVIQGHAAGRSIRRVTLFDHLGKSAESSASRNLITSTAKYGLIKGNYRSETLELTEEGRIATGEDTPEARKRAVWIDLAIVRIEPFNALFTRFAGAKLPSRAVLMDTAAEVGVPAELREEMVSTFIVNAQFVGLLRTMSGAERLLTRDHALEDASPQTRETTRTTPLSGASTVVATASADRKSGFDEVCFYISPIGDESSIERRHADLFLNSFVEPAIATLGLKVVRADRISEPGLITSQILEHVLRAKLVIADLSFHNPNVFYELALRHATRLPTVHIIRSRDRIPFDISQFRTIQMDDTDIYSLIPRIELYRAEIATQARSVLADATAASNPISAYFPGLKTSIA